MRTKTLLTFDELSPENQQKALDNNRAANVDDEFLLNDFEQQLTILGFTNLKIQYSGFGSRGDGLSFTGDYSPNHREPGELYYPACKRLQAYLKHKHAGFTVERIGHRYSHENTICVSDGESENLEDLIRDICREFYKALEYEYDYQTNDEQVAEFLRANEVEFER